MNLDGLLEFWGICVPSRPHNEEKVVGETNITQNLCGSYVEKKLINIAIWNVDFVVIRLVGKPSALTLQVAVAEVLF